MLTVLKGTKHGFGMNIWDVPFDEITKFYKVCSPKIHLPSQLGGKKRGGC